MSELIPLFAEMNRLCKIENDFKEAAGELLIGLPEPGTDLARVICANSILKQEISKLRKVEAAANHCYNWWLHAPFCRVNASSDSVAITKHSWDVMNYTHMGRLKEALEQE